MKTNKQALHEIEKILVDAYAKIKEMESQPLNDRRTIDVIFGTKASLSALISQVEAEIIELGGE